MTALNPTKITPFIHNLNQPLSKGKITVLQINVGKRCNLACHHCHVEASPKRTEELSPEICEQLIQVIEKFSQIETVDLTGGAPEMNYGFHPIVEAARKANKEVIVRSNLTIFFESGFEYLPQYFAENQLRVVASLPCYLEENVDKQRGKGVYNKSIKAIQKLNKLGYGIKSNLVLDLIYNPSLPRDKKVALPPEQKTLEQDYKSMLKNEFDIVFNKLFTLINMPIGRTKEYLKKIQIYEFYLKFLENNFNPDTIDNLMCRNQLSVDYLGNIYDCDFNQMENLNSRNFKQEDLTVQHLLEADDLDIIETIKTDNYCYGCTAGSGASCQGALV